MPSIRFAPFVLIGLAVLLALALACAPVAPPNQSGDAVETPKPPDQGDKPTLPPDDKKPTPTPKPTLAPLPGPKDDQEPKPEPSRDPDDPPAPTPDPGEPPDGGYQSSLTDVPHPTGLDGCRALSPWSSSAQEMDDYYGWCSRELSKDVTQHCQGVGGTDEERACADARLADVKDYSNRAAFTPCYAISDRADARKCARETSESFEAHHLNLLDVWNGILLAVHSDAEVKERFRATAQCVGDLGYDVPKDDRPFTWQEIDPKRLDGFKLYRDATTEQQIADEEERLAAINQCAADTGLYDAQDSKWQAEISRIAAENPDRLIPLKQEGIIDLLQEDGPAPFLVTANTN